MAWLKFETDTPEKPEVFAITVALGWDDPDLTIGKLMKVWRWFDKHTIEGNAPSVTLALLDSITGVSGFAKAMCDVGWLLQSGNGLSLPNFDRHNGETAKERAQTAKRVAKHKTNAVGNGSANAASVTSSLVAPLPKEEKKRKEEEHVNQKQGATPPALPAWLPIKSWNGYLDMRKKRKKPPTDRAVELLLAELERLHAAGQDIGAVLDKSTVNGWTDVYAIKDFQTARASPGRPADGKFNFSDVDRRSDATAMAASMQRHKIAVPDGEIEI